MGYIQKEIATGLAIRSESKFADGTPSKCTPYELGQIWDTILSKMIASPGIKLGQIIRNYADKESKPEEKKAMFEVLFNIAMAGVQDNLDMVEEVATIGIGMMFKDNLDNSNPMSIVHIVNNRAISVLETPVQIEQEGKVA